MLDKLKIYWKVKPYVVENYRSMRYPRENLRRGVTIIHPQILWTEGFSDGTRIGISINNHVSSDQV